MRWERVDNLTVFRATSMYIGGMPVVLLDLHLALKGVRTGKVARMLVPAQPI